MDSHEYRIESLGNIFAKHAEEADKNNEIHLEKYKENYPDSPIPEHMKNPFNVAKAFSVMACEIERLKNSNF